jgi:tetratricopeptide (TPR) repeat protein
LHSVLHDVTCRQLFLASPGGLEPERKACRDVFREHNESRALDERAFFYVHAWEDVPGGVGRPQGRINPRMDGCDYAVVLFHDRWGSPPSKDGKYSSGTEEEFHRACELLADAGEEMRDILVLFKTLNTERMRDPGPDLQKVLDFRSSLEKSHTLTFEVFDSETSLRHRVEGKMREWLKDDGVKQPRVIDLAPSPVETSTLRTLEPEKLLAAARSFATDRLFTQAEAAYAAAVAGDDPRIILEFGQFMRRTGRTEKAMELNRRVVDDGHLLASPTGEAAGLRVRAMSNIGVLQRHLGELGQSAQTLREAVRTAETSREPIPHELCYALDNYAHSLLRTGAIEAAREHFENAHAIRIDLGTSDEQAQSAINLGRFHLEQCQREEAIPYFVEALDLLDGESDLHLRANALAGQAEALIRLGLAEESEPLLAAAYGINEQLNNQKGLGIIHGLQARYLLQTDRPEEADEQIAATQEIADETGDVQGLAVAAILRTELAWRAGDKNAAARLLTAAEAAVAGASDPGLRDDVKALARAIQEA